MGKGGYVRSTDDNGHTNGSIPHGQFIRFINLSAITGNGNQINTII
jgi:hypothetical protein